MKVLKLPPFLQPSFPFLQAPLPFPLQPPLGRLGRACHAGLPALPVTLLRAAALDLVTLSGRLVLYPTGIGRERPSCPLPPGGTQLLPAEGRSRPPVVLLHGFADNRSVFLLLRRSLTRHGWRDLESLNHSPLTCDIRAAAEVLGQRVEEICARTGHLQVDVVGHSLGGLIARYYAQRLGGDVRIRVLVTLGTPHAGTVVAPLAGIHPVVRQMRPGSALIEELRLPAPGCGTRFVSFWSDLDQMMSPARAARLEHPDLDTRNVLVRGIGHLALPVHPVVATGIRHVLEPVAESALAPRPSGPASAA